MEELQQQGAAAPSSPPATAPTSTVVSSDDFFSDAPASAASILPDAPAAEAPAASVLPASAEPAASGEADAPASGEAIPPPAADASGDDPWASLDLEDAPPPPATQPSAEITQTLTAIATSLGLDALPQTPAELQAAVDAEVARRVAVAAYDPVREIDTSLGLSDRELVRADLQAHRTRYDTDASLESRLDEMEDENRLTTIATELRTELSGKRNDHVATRQAQLKAQADNLLAAQQQMDAAIQKLTDPKGAAMTDKIKSTLSAYGATQQYLADLLNQPTEWHVQQMARLHPKIGPVYRQMETAVAEARGATALIKELEHQTPELGGGAALPTKTKIVGADDFFAN